MKGEPEKFSEPEMLPGFGVKQALTTLVAAVYYLARPEQGEFTAFNNAEYFVKLAEERYGEMKL